MCGELELRTEIQCGKVVSIRITSLRVFPKDTERGPFQGEKTTSNKGHGSPGLWEIQIDPKN